MNNEAFERREALLNVKEKLLLAEEQRISGAATIPLDKAINKIQEKINEK